MAPEVRTKLSNASLVGIREDIRDDGPDVPHEERITLAFTAIVIFLVSFALYFRTLYPTTAGGDATEFAFHACQWGVPHPPGYPTFAFASNVVNIAAKPLLDLLGVQSNVAHRANLTAAIFGAAANAAVFLAACRVAGLRPAGRGGIFSARWRPRALASPELWAGLLCALAFGASRLHWHYSLQSEVFSLNNLFAASLLLCHSHLRATGDVSWAEAGAFLSGLGMTNQHTLALFVAPLALHAMWTHRKQLLTVRGCLRLGALFTLGLLPYVYLPLASLGRMPGSWGDQTTLSGLLTHLLRREYGSLTLYSGLDRTSRGAQTLNAILLYAKDLSTDTAHLAWPLLGISWFAVRATNGERSPGFHMTAFCWLFYTVVFMYLANLPISKDELYLSVLERFWMQSHVAAYLLVAPGLTTVLEALGITVVGAGGGGVSEAGRGKGRGGSGREKSAGKKERKGGKDGKEEGRKEGAAARWLSHLGIVAKEAQEVPGRSSEKEDRGGGLLHRLGVGTALAVAVASVAAMRIPNMDESSSWAIYRAAADMLASVPEHGRLMIHGDLKTNNVRYLIQCEHLRDDVELWEIQFSTFPWFWKMQRGNVPSFDMPKGKAYYHPYQPLGFSMVEFLDTQFAAHPTVVSRATGDVFKRGPLALMGGWHEEDHSHAGRYSDLPFGGSSLIVPAKTPAEWLLGEAPGRSGGPEEGDGSGGGTRAPFGGDFAGWLRASRALLRPLDSSLHMAGAIRGKCGGAETIEGVGEYESPPVEHWLRQLEEMRGAGGEGERGGKGGTAGERGGAAGPGTALEEGQGEGARSLSVDCDGLQGERDGCRLLERAAGMSPRLTEEGRRALEVVAGGEWVPRGEVVEGWLLDRRRWEWQAEWAQLGAHLERASAILAWVEGGSHRGVRRDKREVAEALKEAIATYEALFCLWEERGPGKTLANYMWWRNLGSAYSQLRYVTMDVGDSETRVRMRRAYKRYLEASERGGIRLSKKLRNDLEAVIEGRVPY